MRIGQRHRRLQLAQPLQISLLIRHPSLPLRIPQCCAQRFQHRVLGLMRSTQALRELPMDLRNASGPVGCDLLADGQVKPHVQKRILTPAFRGELGAESGIARFQPRNVFRVLRNDRRELAFQRLEGLAGTELPPRVQVHAAHLIAVLSGKNRHGYFNRTRPRGRFFRVDDFNVAPL